MAVSNYFANYLPIQRHHHVCSQGDPSSCLLLHNLNRSFFAPISVSKYYFSLQSRRIRPEQRGATGANGMHLVNINASTDRFAR